MNRSALITGLLGLVVTAAAIPSEAAAQDRYCREYTRTITIGSQILEGYGTACMQPDGSWEIVSEQTPREVVPAAPAQTVIYKTYHTVPARPVVIRDRRTYAYSPLFPVTFRFDKYHDHDRHGRHKHYERDHRDRNDNRKDRHRH